MSNNSPTTPSAPERKGFIANLLAQHNIKFVALIDDAYDPIYNNEVSLDAVMGFHSDNEIDTELDDLLNELGIAKPSDDDLQDEGIRTEYLNNLWLAKKDSAKLKSKIYPLFVTRIDKENDLATITKNLEGLGVSVKGFPSNVSAEELRSTERSFDFVFIDYFLGTDNTAEAIKRAEEKINEIHKQYPDGKKPVTVLMSSSPNAWKQKEQFRKNAKLVEGVFRFSSKSDLKDEHILSLTIGALAKEFIKSHDIQSYVNSLCNAAEQALKHFQEDIRSLNVEDYVFIQNQGLEKDEQPLGDYLGWLFSSYWEQLLFKNSTLLEEQKKMDKIFNSSFPIMYGHPSEVLNSIYMNTLFENIGDIKSHPRRHKEALNAANSENVKEEVVSAKFASMMYLHLGDMFIKSESETVWMVINAQCDLERTVSNDLSIFLIPGKLVPWRTVFGQDEEALRTEFFRFNNKSFKIVWDAKKVMSKPFIEMMEWKSKNQLTVPYRLRLPFALEIQRAFTTKLNRIGLPIAPPLSTAINIEVFGFNLQGELIQILPPVHRYASIVGAIGPLKSIKSSIIFNMLLGRTLVGKLREIISSVDAEKEDTSKWALKALFENFDEWFLRFASQSHQIPEAGKGPKEIINSNSVYLVSDWNNKGFKGDFSKYALIINILNNEK